MVATKDKVVAFHYVLRDGDGAELDRSDAEPMPYLHGHRNIVPGLEKQMDGRAVGEKVTAVVAPEDGYGMAKEDAIQQISREAFGDMQLAAGMELATEVDDQVVPFWILEVADAAVTVDFNHPLAGQTLHFEVEVVAVRDATADELAHGHPHGLDGTGGHHH